MKAYKGAFVGFGAVAENAHAPAFEELKDRFCFTAVADGSKARREAALKYWPDAKTYENFEDLLLTETDINFVVIATPPLYHFKAIKQALNKGLHVICEKPLVFSVEEFDQLKQLAQSKNLVLFTVHNWKYAPSVTMVKEIIGSGKIGSVKHVGLHVLRTKPSVTADGNNWRASVQSSGGGIYADHGWHNFYLAYHLAGKELNAVTASMEFNRHGAEEVANAMIEFKDNVTAQIYLSWKSALRKNIIMVHGTGGTIVLDDDVAVINTKDGTQTKTASEKLTAGSAHPTWMAGLLKEFVKSLDLEAQRGLNLSEAAVCVKLLTGGYASAKEGKRIVFK